MLESVHTTYDKWKEGSIAVLMKYFDNTYGWWYYSEYEGQFWYESSEGDYEPSYTESIVDILDDEEGSVIVPIEAVNRYSKRCER